MDTKNSNDSNGYKEALKKAEFELTSLQNATGGDEAARRRKIGTQEIVVRGFRRLANHVEKLAA